MALRERAVDALDAALAALSAQSRGRLYASVTSQRARLDDPMRVAVVGRIKAGKSTMINALLGAELAPTGGEELTFNVTAFRYDENGCLRIHFKDGRPPQTHPLQQLGSFVDRTQGDPETLRSILRVEVGLPHAILDRLELIDTPGFSSFFEADSRNTLAYLGLTEQELDDTTRGETAAADAIVYLFTRGVSASDRELVSEFEGASAGDFTPVNAVAVLTKVDAYWSAASPDADPLDTARRITTRQKSEPQVERLFFDVVPVCGLLADGAQTLSPADHEALDQLARLPPLTLARHLKNAGRFVSTGDEALRVDSAERASLIRRLGQYGIWIASRLIREGSAPADDLTDRLVEISGLNDLHGVLLSHYGDRAMLIKAGSAVNRSRELCSRAARNGDEPAVEAAAVLEAFELDEHPLTELALLRRLYRDGGRLGLAPDDVRELITVCGEQGSACSARLGMPPGASIPELLECAHERVGYWRERADAFGLTSQTLDAIRDIRRSYEVVAYHLQAAREHLEMTT